MRSLTLYHVFYIFSLIMSRSEVAFLSFKWEKALKIPTHKHTGIFLLYISVPHGPFLSHPVNVSDTRSCIPCTLGSSASWIHVEGCHRWISVELSFIKILYDLHREFSFCNVAIHSLYYSHLLAVIIYLDIIKNFIPKKNALQYMYIFLYMFGV